MKAAQSGVSTRSDERIFSLDGAQGHAIEGRVKPDVATKGRTRIARQGSRCASVGGRMIARRWARRATIVG